MLIRLTPAENPAYSVAMVLYGGGRLALDALGAVARLADLPYEVIVVDNASPDASGALVRLALVGGRFVRNTANRGFGPAMNQAIALARAPYVLLLNPDTVVRPGWDRVLVAALESHPCCAAVSPVLLDPDGSVQEAGASVDDQGFTHPTTVVPTEDVVAVDYASAAALLVRRSAVEAVGGFDESFAPAYFEDVDLALRLGAAGWSTCVARAAEVVHHRGGTDVGGAAARHFAANRDRFLARWAAELAARQAQR